MKTTIALLLSLLLTLCFAPQARADYDPYRLYELIDQADVVVAGEITKLDEGTFELTVERWIVGDGDATQTVHRFRDWICAGRWAPYEVGQRVLVFGRHSEKADGPLGILSAGGEGELLMLGDDVFATCFAVQGFQNQEAKLLVAGQEETLTGVRIDLDEVAAAVIGFRETFRSTARNERGYRNDYHHRQAAADTAEFAATSTLARHLAEQIFTTENWEREPTPTPRWKLTDLAVLKAADFKMAGMARVHPDAVEPKYGRLDQTNWGSSLASIGDLNGDGISEYAVGAPRDSFSSDGNGAVWIIFPDAKGIPLAQVAIEAQDVRIRGSRVLGAQFGHAVAGIGDLNGDGIPDLAVSASTLSAMGTGSGAVFLLMLDEQGHVSDSMEIIETVTTITALAEAGETLKRAEMGDTLTNIGDLDGDGFPELLIASGGYSLFRGDYKIHGLIASLGPDREQGYLRKMRPIFKSSDNPLAKSYGTSVGVGDINGDGVPDLAISEPMNSDGGEYRGAVWICMMGKNGEVLEKQCISDWQGGFEGLLLDGANFGSALAAPGDVDGDGVADLIVRSQTRIWLLHLSRNGKVKDSKVVINGCGNRHGANLSVHEGLLFLSRFKIDSMRIIELSDI